MPTGTSYRGEKRSKHPLITSLIDSRNGQNLQKSWFKCFRTDYKPIKNLPIMWHYICQPVRALHVLTVHVQTVNLFLFFPPDVQTSLSPRTQRSTTSTGQRRWRRWLRGCLTRLPEMHFDWPLLPERTTTETQTLAFSAAAALPVCDECFVQRCDHDVFMSLSRSSSVFRTN